MSKILNKFWNESIKNNLVAALLFAALTVVYNLVKAQIYQTNFIAEFKSFWTLEIKLWILVLASLALYLLILIIKTSYKKGFKYDAETLELDRNLFNRIRNELLTDEIMSFTRKNGFSSSSFEDFRIEFILILLEESKKPDFEFFNPILERNKLKLIEELVALEYCLGINIFNADVTGYLDVPREWPIEKRSKIIELLRELENNFCEEFDSFIKKGRRILKI